MKGHVRLKGQTHLQNLCLSQNSIHVVPNVHMLEPCNIRRRSENSVDV